MSKPVVLVFAGPNGSGKTTITKLMPHYGVYVNADDMKKEYALSDLEAAQKAEALRNKLAEKKADFTFETVLSTKRNLLLLRRAKESGYEIQCIYVLTCNADINYDNSIMPSLVFKKDKDENDYFPTEIWPMERLKRLLSRKSHKTK